MPETGAPVDRDSRCVGHPRVLVLYGGEAGQDSEVSVNARNALQNHRIEYEEHAIDESIAYRVDEIGQYAAIVATDYAAYRDLDADRRAALDRYALSCDAGIFFLTVPPNAELNGGEVVTSDTLELASLRVEPKSPILDLTRDGGVIEGSEAGKGRRFELRKEASYQTIAWATAGGTEAPEVLADYGGYDGIRRVFSGHDFDGQFLNSLLFVDSLMWLSPIELGVLRDRYIEVDIDDIFQPNWNTHPEQRTVKIQADDVRELIATQQRISSAIDSDFRFVLGFNMGFFHEQYGDPAQYDDAAGDDALVEHRSEFYWFDHLKRHNEVISQPTSELVSLMNEARDWAMETRVIDYMTDYAVTPQHSGISEQYTPLYQAWHEVWDVRYSSDRSDAGDGFEYMGVRVAPRTDAGIWSSESSFADVSPSWIERQTRGGSVYRGIIARPVSIYMTHQSNYARDRIGNSLFEQLIEFITRWTRYRIYSGTPEAVVRTHFEFFPLDCAPQPSNYSYADSDGDGFGDATKPHGPACPVRTGFVDNTSDCDDTHADVHPGAAELCNGIDDDCDSKIDEGLKSCDASARLRALSSR